MALAIAALLTLALLLAIPAGLIFLELESRRNARHYRDNVLPALKRADAKRKAAREAGRKVSF